VPRCRCIDRAWLTAGSALPWVPNTNRCDRRKVVAPAPRRIASGRVRSRLPRILAPALGAAHRSAAIASKTVAESSPTLVRPVSSIVSAYNCNVGFRRSNSVLEANLHEDVGCHARIAERSNQAEASELNIPRSTAMRIQILSSLRQHVHSALVTQFIFSGHDLAKSKSGVSR
jgi:hypothetical protein